MDRTNDSQCDDMKTCKELNGYQRRPYSCDVCGKTIVEQLINRCSDCIYIPLIRKQETNLSSVIKIDTFI